jgi:hypothetical protein
VGFVAIFKHFSGFEFFLLPSRVQAHALSTTQNVRQPIGFLLKDVIHMSPIRMARLESGVRVVLAFNEAFNRHDVAGMMRLMSDDCVGVTSARPSAMLRERKPFGALMGDPDPEKSKRVTNAMLKMQKIIVADLQKAHGG